MSNNGISRGAAPQATENLCCISLIHGLHHLVQLLLRSSSVLQLLVPLPECTRLSVAKATSAAALDTGAASWFYAITLETYQGLVNKIVIHRLTLFLCARQASHTGSRWARGGGSSLRKFAGAGINVRCDWGIYFRTVETAAYSSARESKRKLSNYAQYVAHQNQS
jgi:hypothetical protein